MRPARDARDDLIDDLRAQLVGTQAQLAEARADLETLRAAQTIVERTDWEGASTSWSVPDPETISLCEQLAATVARVEEAQRDLSTRSGELQDALTRETDTRAELTEASQQLSELRSQVTQRDLDLPREVGELQMRLSLELRDCEQEWARWEAEPRKLVEEQDRLMQQMVQARASLITSDRMLKAAEDRYQRGRERARQQGQGSIFTESFIATSSQYERNVQEAAAAQRSTSSHASMRPPAPRLAADPGEAESSHQQRPAEGGGESDQPAEGGGEC
ncbi:hypothetical protein Taro_019132 [Colocasia esculenta]|uniref:Uncharacterized protein n=1 Tax=Colocasia esculenta TaxID=4460 RepID=A0A843V4K9_COLES|nr:hypothetical protein [Colocasia esculenta]